MKGSQGFGYVELFPASGFPETVFHLENLLVETPDGTVISFGTRFTAHSAPRRGVD